MIMVCWSGCLHACREVINEAWATVKAMKEEFQAQNDVYWAAEQEFRAWRQADRERKCAFPPSRLFHNPCMLPRDTSMATAPSLWSPGLQVAGIVLRDMWAHAHEQISNAEPEARLHSAGGMSTRGSGRMCPNSASKGSGIVRLRSFGRTLRAGRWPGRRSQACSYRCGKQIAGFQRGSCMCLWVPLGVLIWLQAEGVGGGEGCQGQGVPHAARRDGRRALRQGGVCLLWQLHPTASYSACEWLL